jgi:predicted ATP-grasp superfamily ATP-dependent carboligase
MAKILIPENPMERNVLAAIRSLGRHGHDIHVAWPLKKIHSKAFYLEKRLKSRFVKKLHFTANPLKEPERFISDILAILENADYDVLMPFTSNTFPLVSRYRARLATHAKMICCDFETYSKANDKETITFIAEKLGLSVPKSICPASISELEEQIKQLTYPVVVKARVNCGMQRGLRYAVNIDELIDAYRQMTGQKSVEGLKEFNRPLVQEVIPGKIYDAVYYYNQGQMVAYLTQCRQKTTPLSGGPGIENITVKDENLFNYGKLLLDHLNWHGPAMVETKLDPRDNQYKLIEINPKFWGTLDLSIQCGVNFPEIALEIALNGKPRQTIEDKFEADRQYRWFVSYIKAHRAAGHSRINIVHQLLKKVDFRDLDFGDMAPTVYTLLISLKSLALS